MRRSSSWTSGSNAFKAAWSPSRHARRSSVTSCVGFTTAHFSHLWRVVRFCGLFPSFGMEARMSSAMRMMNAMVLVVTLGVGHSPAGAQESAFEERHERRTNFLVGKAHLMADVARQGAIRRLSRPACQQVLDEFTDSAGRALTTNLAAMGLSAAEALTALYLVDAGDAMQCRTNDGVVAFTTTRGRVIYVCGKHFVERAT